jgi:hypothetical protein
MFEGEKSKILPIFACKVVVSQFFHIAFGETGGGKETFLSPLDMGKSIM